VALIDQESGFDPTAVHKNSDGTADEGIAQFHRPYPAGVTLTNPFDPVESLNAAAQYWNILRTYPWIGDNPIAIVAAYNGGPAGTRFGFSPAVERHVANVRARVGKYAKYAGTATVPPPAPQTVEQRPEVQAQGGVQGMIDTAQHWAAILRAWYEMGGELFGGALVVRGHPAWNIGHRLLTRDARGEWEAYIEGVSHRFDMRTGQYLTDLRITRGWYLSAAIAQQIWDEGRTQVTAAAGGPPVRDPATGEEIPSKSVTITHVYVDGVLVPVEELDRLEER
jgi:transglycosylase-like protein with SLT domain